jgi:hypothetical protein
MTGAGRGCRLWVMILVMVAAGLLLWVGVILLLDRENGPDGQIADRLRRHERPGPLADEAERWLRGDQAS